MVACVNAPIQLVRNLAGYDDAALAQLNTYVTGGLSPELADGLTGQGLVQTARAMTPQADALYNAGAANWMNGITLANLPLVTIIFQNHPAQRAGIISYLEDVFYHTATSIFEQNKIDATVASATKYAKSLQKVDSHKSPVKFAEAKYPFAALLIHISLVVKQGASSVFAEVLERVYDADEGKFLVKWKGTLPKIETEAQWIKICNHYVAVARRIGGMGDPQLWEDLFETIGKTMPAVGGPYNTLKLLQEVLVHLDTERSNLNGLTLQTVVGSPFYNLAFTLAFQRSLGEHSPDASSTSGGGTDDDKKYKPGHIKKTAFPEGDPCNAKVTVDRGAGVRFGRESGLMSFCNAWNRGESCIGKDYGCCGTGPATSSLCGWCSFAHACPLCGLSSHRKGDAACKGKPGRGKWPAYRP